MAGLADAGRAGDDYIWVRAGHDGRRGKDKGGGGGVVEGKEGRYGEIEGLC